MNRNVENESRAYKPYRELTFTDDFMFRKIFINARGKREKVSNEMNAFLDYLCGKEASSNLTKDIELGLRYAKEKKPWEVEYMTLYDEIRMERMDAYQEGAARTKLEDVSALVDRDIFNAEKACEVLGVSIDDYRAYISND